MNKNYDIKTDEQSLTVEEPVVAYDGAAPPSMTADIVDWPPESVCPCVVLEEDDQGRIILTPQMKADYAQAEREYAEGRCLTFEELDKSLAEWN